jgi:hypothetical protein
MKKVLVEEGYRVALPDEVHYLLRIGAPIWVTMDETGRIILTPEAQIRAVLMETFGMWEDRDDIPHDGVSYMDQIRQGKRLADLEHTADEDH